MKYVVAEEIAIENEEKNVKEGNSLGGKGGYKNQRECESFSVN